MGSPGRVEARARITKQAGSSGASRLSWPLILLGVACAASIVLLLALGDGDTFNQDEWTFIQDRFGFDAASFFAPHNEHIVIIPAALYKLCWALFGMTTVGPERVLAILTCAAAAVLMFFYVRRRLGDWLALFAAVLLLFLGRSWEDLLWPFELQLVGAAAAGIGMLLALERGDKRGDVLACVLACVSVATQSLGLMFAFGAGLDVVLRRRERGLSRAYIALVPVALYGLWYLTYGYHMPHNASLGNVATSPQFVLDSVSSGLETATGISTIPFGSSGDPEWGRLMLAGLVVCAGLFLRGRADRLTTRFWVVAGAGAAFWVLGAFNYVPGREATVSRYQYVDVIFILLILAELLRGLRMSRRGLSVAAGFVAIAIGLGMVSLTQGASYEHQQSDLARTDLSALEIARGRVAPDFLLDPVAGMTAPIPVVANQYFAAVNEYGSPAAPRSELLSSSDAQRRQVDVILAHALPVNLNDGGSVAAAAGPPPQPVRTEGALRGQASCIRLSPAAVQSGAVLRLPPGGALISADRGGSLSVGLRRYAPSFRLSAGSVGAGRTATLVVPTDRSEVAWLLRLTGGGPATVCGRRA